MCVVSGSNGDHSLWLAASRSKRWGELFFLAYSPFWITALLGVVVPLRLYEVKQCWCYCCCWFFFLFFFFFTPTARAASKLGKYIFDFSNVQISSDFSQVSKRVTREC